jgi:hypothetical protein
MWRRRAEFLAEVEALLRDAQRANDAGFLGSPGGASVPSGTWKPSSLRR